MAKQVCAGRLSLDTSEFEEIMGRAAALLEDPLEIPSELGQRFIRLLKVPSEVFSVILEEGTASGTGEIRACLKPSDSLLDLMAALQARHGELDGLVKGHRVPHPAA